VTITSRRVTSCTYADRVAFPDEVLAGEEEVVLHLHPHWRVAVGPALLLLTTLAVMILAWVMLPQNDGGLLAFAVVALIMVYYGIRYGLRPLVAWRCTHYVVTDERILLQDGVIARERRDLPLNRVNDHAVSQSVLDRLTGAGTLTVTSIGNDPAVLAAMPGVYDVQTLLYELIESLPEDEEEEDEPEPELPVQRRGIFGRRTAK
jgi:uncharacterized membrane protein YdbT with pleckstrin-like domain